MTRLLFFVLTVVLCGHSGLAGAATYYVATTGNNAAAGTIGAPWQTVAMALATMVAGDTTYVRGGTYTEYNLNFARSGTAGNVITLKNYPSETPIIDSGVRVTNGRNPIFLLDGVHYITLDGLTLQYGMNANIYLSHFGASTNITIQNCELTTFIQQDNAAHIYLDPGSHNILIQNNRLHDYITGGYSGNAANGVIVFQPGGGRMDVTIRNNEIYGNLIAGIHYKHGEDSETNSVVLIQNNLIRTTGSRSMILNRNGAQVRNNVIYGGIIGITLFIAEGAGSADNVVIDHNTIVQDGGIEVNSPADHASITNNLITGITTNADQRGLGVYAFDGADVSSTTLNYTLIHSDNFTTVVRLSSGSYTMSTIPGSVLGQVGLLSAAPIFVNAGARNYTLTAASPGYHAASDGTDMGANIALVGVGNGGGGGGGDTTPPAAPTGVYIARRM